MAKLEICIEDGSGSLRTFRVSPDFTDAYGEEAAAWALAQVQEAANQVADAEGVARVEADLDRDCAEASVELKDGTWISIYSVEQEQS